MFPLSSQICKLSNLLLALQFLFLAGGLSLRLDAKEESRRSFALAAGDAEVTLEAFSEQAGVQIVYLLGDVHGVATNAVYGDFVIDEALERLVADTGLRATQDGGSGAFVIKRDRLAPMATEATASNTNATRPMKPKTILTTLSAWLALMLTPAQPAFSAAAPDAATLAKYDKNKNGTLDESELAQMRQDETKDGEAVMLNPFEVRTEKDVGYAAGNTLSGGRVDTPIAITPGSISVMTKEFLEDFNITNMNEALNWAVGMEPGTLTPGSDPFGASTYGTRVRGNSFDSNFPVRNGNLNYGVADSYNSERFEFNRGPDTAMFGDGGPGGRQGSGSKQARFDSTAVSVGSQIDSYGGYRGTLDYGKGWERFALRVNVLRQNRKSFQDETNLVTTGLTLNAKFKLAKNTTFTAEYERKDEANNMWSKTLGDQANFWDGVTVNSNNTSLGTTAVVNALGMEQVSATNDYLAYNFSTGSFYNYKGFQYRSRGIGFRIGWNDAYPYIPKFQRTIEKNFNLSPKDNLADRDTGNFQYTLDHRVNKDLFLQLVYWRNDFDVNQRLSAASPNEYRLDLNQRLPDGTLNPKFLKRYSDVTQSTTMEQDFVREYRGLATYKFSIPSFFSYKQQLSSTFGFRQTRFENRNNSWRWANNPLQADATNANNQVRYRVYWDDPRAELGKVFTDPNLLFPAYKFVRTEDGGTINKRQLKFVSLTSQSAFFDEKLAITGSLRFDDVEGDFLPRLSGSGAPDYKNVMGYRVAGAHALRHQKTYSPAIGVVVYPFPTRYRWLSPLGFVWNQAQNNQQISSQLAPLYDGTEVPLTKNKTRDFGLRYSMAEGKAYITVSRYDTKTLNSIFGMGNLGNMRDIWTNLGYTDPALTSNAFSYADLRSNRTEGWEVELTMNPTRNLTVTANYGHPLQYTISDSEQKRMIYEDNIAEWNAGANATAGTVLNGKTVINPQLIRDNINAIESSLNGLTPGTLGNRNSRHRYNFAARYRFSEGMLRGLGVNVGFNLRTHTKIGSRDAQIKFGTTTPTAAQIKEAAYDYLWTGPTYSVTAGANYSRRFGKYNTRFQLNVDNLTDNQSLIWDGYGIINANQLLNGNPRMQVRNSWTQYDPRKYTFSTTVSF